MGKRQRSFTKAEARSAIINGLENLLALSMVTDLHFENITELKNVHPSKLSKNPNIDEISRKENAFATDELNLKKSCVSNNAEIPSENEGKNTGCDHNLDYKKREGTVNDGGDYEMNLTALYAIRLSLNSDVDDVLIASNAEGYGAFDDIVIRVQYRNLPDELYAIQLKHKKNLQKRVDFINRKNGDFSLEKYKDSYRQEVSGKLLQGNPDHFVRGIDLRNVTLCLFTNAMMCEKVKKILLDSQTSLSCSAHHNPNREFINTRSNGYYTFQVHPELPEFNKFLRSYVFTGNRKSYEERLKQILAKIDDQLDLTIVTKIGNSFKKLLESKFIKHVQIDFDHTLNDVRANVKKSFGKVDVTLLDKILNELCVYFSQNLVSAATIYKQLPLMNDEYKQFFQQFRFYGGQMNNKEVVADIASTIEVSFGPIHPDTVKQFVEFIRNYFQSDAHSYLLTRQQIKLKLLELIVPSAQNLDEKFRIFKDVTDLHVPEQKLAVLKHVKVSLQGRQAVDFLDIVDENFYEKLTPKFLLEHMCEIIQVGKRLPQKCDNYISRKFYKILLRREVLWKTMKNTFILDAPLKKSDSKLNFVDLTHGKELDEDLSLKNSVVIVTNEDDVDKWAKKLVIQRSCRVHYLKVAGNYLEWKRSWCSVDDLNEFVVEEETVNEEDLMQYFDNKINIICAVSGVGKSTTFNALANLCPSNKWVLKVNLNNADFCEVFMKDHVNALDFIYKKIENDDTASFERELFDYLKRKKMVVVLIDDFDEMSSIYVEPVLNLMDKLQKLGLNIWVATRPIAKKSIQEKFQLMPVNMQGIRDEDLKHYLLTNVSDAKIELKHLMQTTLDFIKVPLHLNMLSTLLQDNTLNWRDLHVSELYEQFIKKKCEIFYKKLGIDTRQNIDEVVVTKDTLIKKNEITALLLIYGKKFLVRNKIIDPDELLALMTSKIGNLGLVTEINCGVPIFSHRSYAEYLTARWLSSQTSHKSFKIMYRILFEPHNQPVRIMFDMIVCRDYPIHFAVVDGNLPAIRQLFSRTDLKMCDQFNRTPLHLAASYFKNLYVTSKEHQIPCMITNEIVRCMLETKSLLRKRDFLGWDWRKYKKISGNKSLFYIACYWGCEAILHLYFQIEREKNIWRKLKARLRQKESGRLAYDAMEYAIIRGEVKTVELLLNRGVSDNYKHIKSLAIKYGQPEILKLMIAKGVKLHDTGPHALTELHSAVSRGKIDLVEMLLGVFDVNLKTFNGDAPLHFAARCGYLDVVKVLTSRGACVDVTDSQGNTPVDVALKHRHIQCADFLKEFKKKTERSCEEDLETHEEKLNLTKIRSKLNRQQREDLVKKIVLFGYNPLCAAAVTGHLNAVESVLIEEDSDNVNANSNDEHVPLHLAVKGGHADVVDFLIAKGADVNHVNKYGRTALHIALHRACVMPNDTPNNLDVLKLLIFNGANVNAHHNDPYLIAAIKTGKIEIIKLLIDFDINLKVQNKSKDNIPLFLAFKLGYFDIVQELILHGAEVNIVDDRLNYTLLHHAAKSGMLDLVKLLIAKGAKLNIKSHLFLNTPLLLAFNAGHLEVVKVLINEGADVNIKDSKGTSFFDLAFRARHWEVVKQLVEKGAHINFKGKRSLLHHAVAADRLDVIECLVKNGVDINVLDEIHKRTPLEYATNLEKHEIVEYLKNQSENKSKITCFPINFNA